MRGERRLHRLHEQLVEVRAAHPLEDDLVNVAEPAGAEVGVAVHLEVVVRELAVRRELLAVGQVLAVGDVEVTAGGGGVAPPSGRRRAEEGAPYPTLFFPRGGVREGRGGDG